MKEDLVKSITYGVELVIIILLAKIFTFKDINILYLLKVQTKMYLQATAKSKGLALIG